MTNRAFFKRVKGKKIRCKEWPLDWFTIPFRLTILNNEYVILCKNDSGMQQGYPVGDQADWEFNEERKYLT